jgi:KUP system potassium uptake protein
MHDDDSPSQRPQTPLAVSAVAALGVVFGDIGTSPLYAMQASVAALGGKHAEPADVIGIISLILWALMLVVSLKYVAIVMKADNDGEGGILALVALVAGKHHYGRLSGLVLVGVVGAALLYGDGVITPAISVLSAIEGLKGVEPKLTPWVVPITLAILVGLFALQSRGTGGLGRLFGPVMTIWFLVLAALGVRGIIAAPQILTALNPVSAAHFLELEPGRAFAVFGLIFLALTGAEALYADMGHFGPRPIRLAWFAMVFPALILNYLGQGGWVLSHPDDADNPFYNLVPGGFLLPMVILAATATVIASQALISGVFSLTHQAIALRLMPRMAVLPTSARSSGQIYVPFVNWALMAMTILIVLGFKSSDALANAYGVAVAATMLATTVLLYRVMTAEWRWPWGAALLLIGLFALVDACFLAANASKFIEGGWLPIVLGARVATCMICWRIGNVAAHQRLNEGSMPMEEFLAGLDQMVMCRVPGTAVFLTRVADRASPMLLHYVRHARTLHENVVLLTVDLSKQPRVPASQRLALVEIGPGLYRLIVSVGFMQRIDVVTALRGCVKLGFSFCEDVHYFIAHEGLVRRAKQPRLPGPVWVVYHFLHEMGLRAADYLHLPAKRVMEVGFRLEL